MTYTEIKSLADLNISKKWVKENSKKLLEMGMKNTIDKFNRLAKGFERTAKPKILNDKDLNWDELSNLAGVQAQYNYLLRAFNAVQKWEDWNLPQSDTKNTEPYNVWDKATEWGEVLERLKTWDNQEEQEKEELHFTIYALTDWEKLTNRAKNELGNFNGEIYEDKLNQKLIAESPVWTKTGLYDGIEHILDRVNQEDFKDMEVMENGKFDDNNHIIKWFEEQILQDIYQTVLYCYREEIKKQENLKQQLDTINSVADYLEVEIDF